MTHFVGMKHQDADKMRSEEPAGDPGDPIERLRAAGITGFFRPA
jgi:hypothetical protein